MYKTITASAVPANLRWDLPQRNAGQTVEVAYADHPTHQYEADTGSKYRRAYDRSDRAVRYSVLAD